VLYPTIKGGLNFMSSHWLICEQLPASLTDCAEGLVSRCVCVCACGSVIMGVEGEEWGRGGEGKRGEGGERGERGGRGSSKKRKQNKYKH